MNSLNPNRRLYGIICAVFFLLIACFLLIVWTKSPVYDSFNPDKQDICRPSVTWHSDTDTFRTAELPARFPSDEQGIAVIRGTLPDDLPSEILWRCWTCRWLS